MLLASCYLMGVVGRFSFFGVVFLDYIIDGIYAVGFGLIPFFILRSSGSNILAVCIVPCGLNRIGNDDILERLCSVICASEGRGTASLPILCGDRKEAGLFIVSINSSSS